ncbi:pentapeptide repeat-containing protein [Sphaerimonospora mesophila]|uniref:pentapeptide repeat-containing protein n=1 Tax=Sphaerimonospora mesophila TaxID=37483 RepID=UPI0006E37C83
MDGRVVGLATGHARWSGLRLHSVEFSDCDLSGLHWTGSALSRVTFTDCKLMAPVIEDLALEDVLFERCRFEYATLTSLRTTGPVIVSSCSLREATVTSCDVTRAAFNECDLCLTTVEGGVWGRCDLRGNDLTGIRGASLKKVILDRSQLPASPMHSLPTWVWSSAKTWRARADPGACLEAVVRRVRRHWGRPCGGRHPRVCSG